MWVLEQQKIQGFADVVVPQKTHAELDADRVAAEALHLTWRKRVEKKTVIVENNVKLALTSIENAIDALRAQAAAITEEYSKHTDAWGTNNEASDTIHRAKIVTLLQHVARKSQSSSSGASDTLVSLSPEPLSPDVKELRDALDEAKLLLATQKDMINAADLRYKEMEARITFLSAPTMSSEEQAARLSQRNESLSIEGKCKGKGVDVATAGLEY